MQDVVYMTKQKLAPKQDVWQICLKHRELKCCLRTQIQHGLLDIIYSTVLAKGLIYIIHFFSLAAEMLFIYAQCIHLPSLLHGPLCPVVDDCLLINIHSEYSLDRQPCFN